MSRPPIFWSQSHKAQVVSLFMMGLPLSRIIGGPVTELISLISADAMVLVGRSSDCHVERCWHFVGRGVLAAGGLLALPFGHGSVLLTTLILIVAGVGSRCIFSLCWVLPTAYLQGRGAAGGIALASMVGAMGSGVSPTIIGFMRVQTGRLYGGLAAVAGIVVFGMALALLFVRRMRRDIAQPFQRVGTHNA